MRLNIRMKYILMSSLLALGMSACNAHSDSHEGHDHAREHAHDDHEHHHDHDHGDDHDHEHGSESGHTHSDGEIVLEPADAERLGVMVDTVRASAFTETLMVSGEILPSSIDRGVVAAPTSGIVRLISGINPGSQVSAGQTIASVTARNISGGDVNQVAKATLDNAKRELDRLTPLLADGLVTRKEYNEALSAYESAKASYSPFAASGIASSPRAGVITTINVGDGEYVETGQVIATVAANSTLTLRALVPSVQADFLPRVSGAVMSFHKGNTVDITDYNGRLLSSAPASASETPGYVPVYFSFSGAAPVIPGNAAEVYLKGAMRADVITLPVGALVEQMGQKFVFIREGDHAYEKRPVTIGNSDGKRIEITSGIEPGEIAVVKGSTFVRLAEQATVAPEGHSHNH